MKLLLEIAEGPSSGRRVELTGPGSYLIGRSPEAHLRLDPVADPRVSRAHCIIEVRPPHLLLVDLDSANGTYLNGRRIRRQALADGDEIVAGSTRIAVRLREVTSGAGATPEATGPPHAPVGGSEASCTGAGAAPARCCVGCDADLSHHANRDGLADDLPDACYLCHGCAAARQAPALAGRRLGDFTLLQPHGRGGMGVVYRAVHEPTRRICALKHLHASAASDVRALRTFEREIDVQSAVHHPNLARVLGRGEAARCFYVAMEFLPGGDAGQLVSRTFDGSIPTALACRLIVQVLSGLAALHAAGFVHRDLKPANLLLSRPHTDPECLAKITDYGLAKSYADAGQSVFNYTQAGEAGGSLLFMAPEQILNFRFVTPPADVYAVGVSLYYLLTGRYTVDLPRPARGPETGPRRSPIDVILQEPPIPVRQRSPAVPPRLAAVVDRAVQKDPAKRFPTAEALRDALLPLAEDEAAR